MSLRQNIATAQTEALKARDEKKLSILRMLWSAIKNLEIDKKHELADEEVQQIVAQMVKQLSEALKDFQAGARADLVESANFEINLLKSYLPEQMSDEELQDAIKKILAGVGELKPNELGKIIGLVMKEVKGKADGNRVREIVSKLMPA